MTKDASKETQEKIAQLQKLEQAIQNSALQMQQFNGQLVELDSALKEIDATDKAYKIVGNIMVAAEKKDLKEELSKKKEMVELRIKTLEKQEERFNEKAKSLQEEVMKELNKEKE
ncbi:MAG: prefoldin subunit beta [Candidatus Woesearchaeota archaeon]